MAKQNANEIAQQITAYIDNSGAARSRWYVGIASDIKQRLFSDHNVGTQNWIWREAFSADDARAIEKYFHQLGCQGGPGGGDESTRFVYAYLITATTKE